MDEEKKSEARGEEPERLEPYVIEVQHTDWARALDSQSAESLLLTLESVLEEVRRMVHAVPGPPKPCFPWRSVAGAATVCALLLALVRLASVSQPPSASSAAMSHEAPLATEPSDFDSRSSSSAPAGRLTS
jgi:hypothetical protein